MNPAEFSNWERSQTEWLVSKGAPMELAVRIMGWARRQSEVAIRGDEDDRQFIIDFREVGSRALAERDGKTQQAIRDRYNKLIAKKI